MPATTAAIIESAPATLAGAASAVFNASRQLGSAIGIAVYGTLAAHGLLGGLHHAVILGSAAAVLGAVLAAQLSRRPPTMPAKP